MKVVNILIGLVIFTVGLSLMFSAASSIFDKGKVNEETVTLYNDLGGDYKSVTDLQTKKGGSTIRSIGDATESGPASSDDQSVFLLTGAIQGGRLIIGSIGNFNNVVNNVTNTINDPKNPGANYIDSRITNAILAVFAIFIIIIAIQFLRGFKFET